MTDGDGAVTDLARLDALAVVYARAGELPPGALEAAAEAGGSVLVVGDGAQAAAGAARSAQRAWWCDTGPGLQPGRLAARLAPLLAGIPLLVLPGTPDGRDLAPRLAACLGRPLLAGACRAEITAAGVRADLCRLDDRVVLPADCDGPAVVTLAPGTGAIAAITASSYPVAVEPIALPGGAVPGDGVPKGAVPVGAVPGGAIPEGAVPGGAVPSPGDAGPDVMLLEVLEPDPSTMDLAEAPLVFGGGAGLAAGLDLPAARAAFRLLGDVAAALGASAGATRVATDAGWIGHERQIGTTGVTIRPSLYAAFGVSGATQHTGGLGAPERIVSVNTDAHCPMTAMSSLGIVADARGTLAALAGRLGVEVPAELRDAG